MMSEVKTFFFRTQGKKSLSPVDWISYIYLLLGFLIIFLPVMWLALNSIKSQFLLQKLDTNILPLDYERIARATVYNSEGKDIFFIKDMPQWVLYWNDLSAEEQALHDPYKFLEKFNGNEFYALRSHFGLISGLAKKYITENNLPDWLLKYPSMFPSSKKEHNPELILETLNIEDQRLLSEFFRC